MPLKTIAVTAALMLSTLPGISQARDTTLYLPFDKVCGTIATAIGCSR